MRYRGFRRRALGVMKVVLGAQLLAACTLPYEQLGMPGPITGSVGAGQPSSASSKTGTPMSASVPGSTRPDRLYEGSGNFAAAPESRQSSGAGPANLATAQNGASQQSAIERPGRDHAQPQQCLDRRGRQDRSRRDPGRQLRRQRQDQGQHHPAYHPAGRQSRIDRHFRRGPAQRGGGAGGYRRRLPDRAGQRGGRRRRAAAATRGTLAATHRPRHRARAPALCRGRRDGAHPEVGGAASRRPARRFRPATC